jgi:hypothetical protein
MSRLRRDAEDAARSMLTSTAPELRRLHGVRITKGLVVGMVVLAVAGVGVGVAFALAGHPSGPPSSWVSLAPGVRVADSANEWFPANVGGPAPGYPYTDIVLVGRPGTSVRSLMRAEYATLRRDGWIYRGTYPTTGEAPVPVGTRGSDAQVNMVSMSDVAPGSRRDRENRGSSLLMRDEHLHAATRQTLSAGSTVSSREPRCRWVRLTAADAV